MNFSEEMEKLKEIAESFERAPMSVEEALSRFEEGVKLVRSCASWLDKTKRRVTMLAERGSEEGESSL